MFKRKLLACQVSCEVSRGDLEFDLVDHSVRNISGVHHVAVGGKARCINPCACIEFQYFTAWFQVKPRVSVDLLAKVLQHRVLSVAAIIAK